MGHAQSSCSGFQSQFVDSLLWCPPKLSLACALSVSQMCPEVLCVCCESSFRHGSVCSKVLVVAPCAQFVMPRRQHVVRSRVLDAQIPSACWLQK